MSVPAPLAYITPIALVAVVLCLGAVLYYNGRHVWHEFRYDHSVAFFNSTDELLCYASGGPPGSSCDAEIRPRAESHWLNNSCVGEGGVTVYRVREPRLLYRQFADCSDWVGAFFIITERNGDLLVVDSLRPGTTHPDP